MQDQPGQTVIWDSIEAARYLRVHPRTVIRMAKQRELPGIRVGRLWRFRKSDVDRWLEMKVAGQRFGAEAK